jgi:hypothetical protein
MAGWDTSSPSDNGVVSAFPANERSQRAFVKDTVGADHDDSEGATKGRHLKVTLESLEGDPTPVAGYGIIFVKQNDAELPVPYFIDEDGEVSEILRSGQAVELVSALLENELSASQFRGEPVILTIDEDGIVECDLSLGLNYYLEMDQNVTQFNFTNEPEIRVPNILVKIKNLGEFDIETFDFTAEGGVVEVPETFTGQLTPAHNKTTDYGAALFWVPAADPEDPPTPLLSIYPRVMKVYGT